MVWKRLAESVRHDVDVISADTDDFKIRADALGSQERDDCKSFYIDETGAQWVNNANKFNASPSTSKDCW